MAKRANTKSEKDGTAADVLKSLKGAARPDKAAFLPGFFQCQPGGYGEGDKFLGVVVPDQRRVARQWKSLPESAIRDLLNSEWHDCRLTGPVGVAFSQAYPFPIFMKADSGRTSSGAFGYLANDSTLA